MKKHAGAYLEGCIASELKLWVDELVGSKFACVLCQRVIVVARIRKSQQNVTGCIDHGEQHATWSTWSAASAATGRVLAASRW